MNNDQRHSAFTLLYAMALIDERVIKVEVDQFLLSAENLLRDIGLVDKYIAEADISIWFLHNYKNIMTEMKLPSRENYLLGHVEKLKSYEHRVTLFEMMKSIAIADFEYHALEQHFLEKVFEVWNLQSAA